MTNEKKSDQLPQKSPTPASVAERLERLKKEKRRPQIALLAENLASVEKALSDGFSMREVWEALREEGFTFTFKTFETSLYLLRKRKAQGQAPKRPSSTVTTPTQPQATPTQPSSKMGLPVASAPPLPVLPPPLDSNDEQDQAFYKTIQGLRAMEHGTQMTEYIRKKNAGKPSRIAQQIIDQQKK